MIDRSETDRTHNRVNSLQIFPQVAETWLRICPAPKLPGESICSVVIRCVLCQVGLATFLTIWTLVAVFLIESFEGPNELQVSLNFERDQNQLVIDLATELRQITPISPKWRYAIERRIEDERRLTMNAVGLGAQIKSGCFWNLSGAFLFTVYVMTALGFGAPVPHTVWGRTLALVYAVLAVPTHIYLMMNASTYVAIKVESYTRYLEIEKNTRLTASANTSINKEKKSTSSAKPNKPFCIRTTIRCMKVALVGRCVPIAIFSYYLLGVVCFGVLRNKNSLECIMFPLEFTTTGGLALFIPGK
ncbi:uncharacterized protein LOC121726192 isoform X2 [Aricia agestis]|uniref:uncharacterized protein LOC121726192 isoform X2 n=1 Tax=Aricia agestis TaxID=91739 RepID=UPI001C201CBB|nr:uncharacterized protein LOC121726192 isoform X2 [Aricia agestis]